MPPALPSLARPLDNLKFASLTLASEARAKPTHPNTVEPEASGTRNTRKLLGHE
jgi:hypothetical protein